MRSEEAFDRAVLELALAEARFHPDWFVRAQARAYLKLRVTGKLGRVGFWLSKKYCMRRIDE